MAALRAISATLLSRSKPQTCIFQRLFFRKKTSKIFVKGLAFSTTEEKLAEAFAQHGNVIKADIVLKKDKKRSKGFGYVTFAEKEEAQKAQKNMNGKILDGRVLYVDIDSPDKHKRTYRNQNTKFDDNDDVHNN